MAKRPASARRLAPAAAAPAIPTLPPAADAGGAADTQAREPSGALVHVAVRSVSPTGRRRAGQSFGPEPVKLRVSEATLELLQGDPQLLVEVV